MRRTSFADMNCSIARTLEVVGEWWALLVVREAFYGVRRFDDFQARLGIARNVLSTRLATLVEHGVLERRQYQDHPPRCEYRLTEKGRALFPVMVTLMQWGDNWEAEGQAPVVMVDRETGHEVDPMLVDRSTGEELKLGRLRLRPDPGAAEASA